MQLRHVYLALAAVCAALVACSDSPPGTSTPGDVADDGSGDTGGDVTDDGAGDTGADANVDATVDADVSIDADTGDIGPDSDAGECPATCFDGDPCTLDGCDESGACLEGLEPAGTDCGAGVCSAAGVCVFCLDDEAGAGVDSGCSPGAPVCDATRCVECVTTTDCAEGLTCDGASGTCVGCTSDEQCDDGLACTADSCEAGECVRVPGDEICGDDRWCNGEELCDPLDAGADVDGCIAGEAPERNDEFTCTLDRCDEETDSMVYEAVDARCDDGNECTVDSCSAETGCTYLSIADGSVCDVGAGVCSGGTCADCVDAGPGRDPGCGGGTPVCVAGMCMACETSDDCGEGLSCVAGACTGCATDAQCDDGVACTLDICDVTTATCSSTSVDAACDDGLFCSGAELCVPESPFADGAGCVTTAVPVVDDGIDCTVDRCDEGLRRIVNEPTAALCNDGNICTLDVCLPTAGCTYEVLVGGGPCDGVSGVCNADAECAVCADTALGSIDAGCTEEAPDCIAGVCGSCTVESDDCPLDCAGVPGGGSYEDLCGACDDDPSNDCLGLCDGVPCGVLCDGSIEGECDDGNPCTVDACTEGRCTNDPEPLEGDDCDDRSVCSVTSVCAAGACVPETTLDCTGTCINGCDPVFGCRAAAVGTACDDGDPLTYSDACNGSSDSEAACVGVCSDGNPCTLELTIVGPAPFTLLCVEPYPVGEGAIARESDDPCVRYECDGAGNTVEIVNEACRACTPEACGGPCYTGACGPQGCVPAPAGTACDDGYSDTTDTCDGNGRCVGACPATECGQRLTLEGFGDSYCGPVYEFNLSGGTSCPDDDNPCTVASCSSEGTCEQVLRSEGASCDHPCGGGACSADGVCELAADQCDQILGPCWTDAACNVDTGTCDGAPLDPYCETPGAVCNESWGFCEAAGTRCGDGVCEGNEVYDQCTVCPADCAGVGGNCNDRITWRKHSSAYQAFASSAYGFEPAHQNVDVTQMLADGLRVFHQIVDYCEIGATSGDVCVCSGNNDCPSTPLRLREPLAEIAEAVEADPNLYVIIYLPHDYVSASALYAEVEASGLLPYTYRRIRNLTTREPWDINLATMLRKNKRVVIFGPGFVSNDNVAYLVEPVFPEGADEELDTGLAGVFDPTFPSAYECADAWGNFPEVRDPRFIVSPHIASGPSPSWIASACYHGFRANHVNTCNGLWPAFTGPINALPFQFYNASSHGTTYHSSTNVIYPDRCLDEVQGCFTDDDCPVGECGGLFICVDCVDGGDCDPDQWCDTSIGVCVAPQADGALCTSDRQCVSDRCEFFLCQSCRAHDDCESTQYCDAFGGCQEKKFNGVGCLTNVECISDICLPALPIGAFCVECIGDQGCDSDEYCDNNPLPGESACQPKKPIGEFCIDDIECRNGNCHATVCSQCDEHTDCAADEYCTLDLIPPIESVCQGRAESGEGCASNIECLSGNCIGFTCVDTCSDHPECGAGRWCDGIGICQDELPNGNACLGNVECESGNCFLGFCVACDEQSDCVGDTFCSLDPLPGASACIELKDIGEVCVQPFECASDACLFGFCVACDSQDDCGGDTFCSLDPLPGASACIATKAIGEVCVQPFECASDACFLGFCVACDSQDDCPGDATFCSLDPAPGESACIATKPNGGICAQNFECTSGNCWATVCSECNEHTDCAGNEYCTLDVTPPINSTCELKKGINEPCASAVECLADACVGFRCGECSRDSQCPAAEHCNTVGECVPDLPNDAVCLRNSMCTSNACAEGFCAECVSDAGCPSNQHCNALNECAPDVAENEPCLRNSFCTTGFCVAGFCGQCASDANCPSNQHCNALAECQADYANNAVCTRDAECSTGICEAGFCAQCRGDAGCPANQHCNAVNDCANDVGNNSPCLRDSFCTTGICSAGFCAECIDDLDCPTSEHCNVGGDCQTDYTNNTACTRNAECSTGICEAGFCAQCRNDAGCPANQHCNAGNDCAADVGNNSPCLRDSFCTTGICNGGFCAECESDADCPSNEHCNALLDCQADYANNAACTRNGECSTGICEALFCAQCRGDADCPTSQHCNAVNDCANDVGNNAACLRDAFCTTGICSAGFCAECESHADCNSNEYCDAGGDCIAKRGTGGACVTGVECTGGCCSFFTCGGFGC